MSGIGGGSPADTPIWDAIFGKEPCEITVEDIETKYSKAIKALTIIANEDVGNFIDCKDCRYDCGHMSGSSLDNDCEIAYAEKILKELGYS